MNEIAIDTDIIIDLANGDTQAIARLQTESKIHRLLLPAIVAMELTVGCRNKQELQALDRLLEQFDILEHGQNVTDIAIELLRVLHGNKCPVFRIRALSLSKCVTPRLRQAQPSLAASGQIYLWSALRRYTLSHGLQIPNAIVAATAIANRVPLLSKNQRDYRFIAQLNLLPYP
ncbi:MAG: PIN domain-containing protein [Geitlerinemataceae cyanobacterium]